MPESVGGKTQPERKKYLEELFRKNLNICRGNKAKEGI